jgi:hypothetical protein
MRGSRTIGGIAVAVSTALGALALAGCMNGTTHNGARLLRTSTVGSASAASGGGGTRTSARAGTPGGRATGRATGGGGGPVSGAPGGTRPAPSNDYAGLHPFTPAPQPPTVKPINLNVPLPPVVSSIPTAKRVVFVTVDADRVTDPGFVQLVRTFKIPITMFLTDAAATGDDSYLDELRDTGYVFLQDYARDRRAMPGLPAATQRAQICGQASALRQAFGVTTYLFRPPFGAYDKGMLRIAKSCGIQALVLWRESMQGTDLRYLAGPHHLAPGDIIRCPWQPGRARRGAMVRMMTALYRQIQAQGFTVANLEDYV